LKQSLEMSSRKSKVKQYNGQKEKRTNNVLQNNTQKTKALNVQTARLIAMSCGSHYQSDIVRGKMILVFIERVSDCCLTPPQPFVRYIMQRTRRV
jgi:hypothetical protein